MPNLLKLAAGTTATIAALSGNQEEDGHLAGIGLYPGARVTILRASRNGQPLLVQIHGSQFMLEREVAEQIFVSDESV